MGTDTKGKQEVDPNLVLSAAAFTDDFTQSIAIGECQHAYGGDPAAGDAITELGNVINGVHPGRTSNDEVTLFDGTGVALQDLSVAKSVVELAEKMNKAVVLDF